MELLIIFSIFVFSHAIIDITDDNFQTHLFTPRVVMVDFFVPWCSDCKMIAPTIELASAHLLDPRCLIARADCMTSAKKLCDSLNIHSWPHLIVFKNGQNIGEYTQARDEISINSFMMATLASNPIPQYFQLLASQRSSLAEEKPKDPITNSGGDKIEVFHEKKTIDR
ncbi:putative protein disulfide-isomerase ER-60 [Thelohanellus kitauei]|uniref:Thioredoxin domain-containing protein n=1 Tax=Thelohanellus kitauei TaxID=669202 RepID=A0A0C2MZ10_THEKT|nr:putative protein disulfide-isomerase ER-60 [Thelohanellus kitauei]